MNCDYQAINAASTLTRGINQSLQGMAIHDVFAEFLFDVGVTCLRERFPGILDAGGTPEESLNAGVVMCDFDEISRDLDVSCPAHGRGRVGIRSGSGIDRNRKAAILVVQLRCQAGSVIVVRSKEPQEELFTNPGNVSEIGAVLGNRLRQQCSLLLSDLLRRAKLSAIDVLQFREPFQKGSWIVWISRFDGIACHVQCFEMLELSLPRLQCLHGSHLVATHVEVLEMGESRGNDFDLGNIVNVVVCQTDALDRILLLLGRFEETIAYSHQTLECLESTLTTLEHTKSDEVCV